MATDAEKILELENKIKYYEGNGVAQLFYALNRKASEMADILNKTKLGNLDLADKNDKTFERIKIVINEATNIATAVNQLGVSAGITNDEVKDTTTPIYAKKPITAESMADNVGELAGQRS